MLVRFWAFSSGFGAAAILGILVQFQRCWCSFGDAHPVLGMLVQFSVFLSGFGGKACAILVKLVQF